ncbi:Core-2/I-branching beta-1 [Forsythia ovata]|uniref:Core-2/I-branching beta-1 n=1 Tax=Forsythia ovata TaxID=205694 RepID=A0ABD1PG09_9LAMI
MQEVEWGKFSMIEAERRLLANALLDNSNLRFILLSEACIPLFNFPTIYNYLMNSTKTFVEAYDLRGLVGHGRYNKRMKPQIKLRQWRKGSQWFELDRQLAMKSRNSNRSLTWVDWSKGGLHPAKFGRTKVTIDLLKKMRNGSHCIYNGKTTNICYLFARKFLPSALDRLLRVAPKLMNRSIHK